MDIDITLLNLDTGSQIALTAIALVFFFSLTVMEFFEKRKASKEETLNSIQQAIRIKSLKGGL